MTLACSTCGSDEVVAVKPGRAEERAEIGIVVVAERRDTAWCWQHWPCRAQQPDLFESAPR